MRAIGADLLKCRSTTLKFVLNDSAVIFFPPNQQHREVKLDGVSYEDEYRGNALAGVITAGRIEIRFHRAFTEERVRNLWTRVLAHPEVAQADLGALYYQGRKLI